ncbi:MAG: Rne/Rng family ribonuclease [Azospirillaceae bacterium]
MAKRMLVDATHPEETRVVVVNGNRLEELDFETAAKKQLKGNIYLAKVTRVEPSLQAAFVEYGGNRHGFLAFSEIHPDYYRIPIADREALVAEEAAGRSEANGGEAAVDGDVVDAADSRGDADGEDGESVETVGGDEVEEAASRRRSRPLRSYKIQEVIKRRQVMLVQVTKEERGTKGAALTTYLSLAGRYCVLMPNTPRGGGVSRKIANPKDRKKMKAILEDLYVPDGMAVILRTAGLERTKAEIKRDLDYLLRLWDQIRTLTLESVAPTLIHEEANLIKRAIRDLYTKDIDEILVSGEEGYRTAKDFMRMLMPSHAKKVQLYKDEAIPLFHRYQVESQIDSMHSPTVQLRSGGYIVINPTEALVAIDVNSGRSTRERNIEETAYKTNLEAAEEVARQLRLRDLAGLIVIDFIDMEDDRHNAAVERRLKEAMRSDRARIQIGRISPFGLLELSRQRLRPSLVETNFETCRLCKGTGLTRAVGSAALHVLRAVEEEGIRKRSREILVHTPSDVALTVLNQKRDALAQIEERYGFHVMVEADDTLVSPDYRLERIRSRGDEAAEPAIDTARVMAATDAAIAAAEEDEEEESEAADGEDSRARAPESGGRGGRRRGRRRRRDDGAETGETVEAADRPETPAEVAEASGGEDEEGDGTVVAADAAGEDKPRKKRRRGKRGGRRRSGQRPEDEGVEGADFAATGEPGSDEGAAPAPEETYATADTREDERDDDVRDLAEREPAAAPAPASSEPVAAVGAAADTADETVSETASAPAEAPATGDSGPAEAAPAPAEKPKRTRKAPARSRKKAPAAAAEAASAETAETSGPTEAVTTEEAPAEKPKRSRKAPARSRKKAPAEGESAEHAATASPADEASEEGAAKAPAPRKRATRTRKAPAKAPARTAKKGGEQKVDEEKAADGNADGESAASEASPAAASEPAAGGEAPNGGGAPSPAPAPARNGGGAGGDDGSEAEGVNQPPEQPRRGWWRRVLDR